MSARKREQWFLILCVIIVAGLAVFEPAYGWKARAWLTGSMVNTGAGGGNAADVADLTAENEALKAQLAQFSAIAANLPTSSAAYLRVMVYSRYPWNFKNELTIDAGADDGVAVGKAAVFNGILIGTVSQVFPQEAVVQTVFDNAFKLPVRVGAAGSDALLAGGSSPEATLISKKSGIMPGDIAYAAAPGIPYGLPVAIVASTSTSPDGLFQNASLNFAYDINTVQALLIAK